VLYQLSYFRILRFTLLKSHLAKVGFYYSGGQGRALPTELFSHFTIHSFEKPSCQGRILLFRGQDRALPTELFSRCVKEHFSLASANIKRFLVYTNKNAKKYHNRHKTFRKIIYPI
jgi:hypothetical protein